MTMGHRRPLPVVLASLLAGLAFPALADYQLNFPPPKTGLAQQIYDMNVWVMWICVGIFVVVFGAMFYAIWKHRKSVGHKAEQFHESTTVEIIWTTIPFLILVAMAWPATKLIIEQKDTSNPDVTVKVVGYQWKWEYDYLQDGVKFMSVLSTPREQIENKAEKGANYLLEVDEPMVVPVGKKVRLLLTANDVIHAWWVPAFGIKQDAIPGFVRDAWFTANEVGTYRGQCAELCGKDHGFMPIVVEVKSEADYKAWLEAKKAKAAAAAGDAGKVFTQAELMERGAKVYNANCASCHLPDGKGIPGAFPAITGSKIATGAKEGHIGMALIGKPGTAMPGFGPQLNDADIAAVVTYQRNGLGNSTGDLVQPADVKALRK
ncbi:MAG: cytochrome c oxidase subunit II [Betaproteobacteria bacterium]|nr:cytochrome c oxidase subunit II [Betaproteobacteria bacterium]